MSAEVLAPCLKNGFPFPIRPIAEMTWIGAVLGPYTLDDVAKHYWRVKEWDVTGGISVASEYEPATFLTVAMTFSGVIDVRPLVPVVWPVSGPPEFFPEDYEPAPKPSWGVIARQHKGIFFGGTYSCADLDPTTGPAFIQLTIFLPGEEVYRDGDAYFIPVDVAGGFSLPVGDPEPTFGLSFGTTFSGPPPDPGIVTIDGQEFDIYGLIVFSGAGPTSVTACDLELTPGAEWTF